MQQALNAFAELPTLFISKNQLETIQETLETYSFSIPEELQNQNYCQLVAHTFSYLKSLHLETISPAKEQELLVKACFIQSHLKDVALDENNQSRSTEQVFALTTLASHLWYQEKDNDLSYSFEQSCLTHAVELQTAYQDLFPKVMATYQDMFSHLPEKQLNTLAQQAIDIAQLSNQPLTKENLNTLAQSAFKNPSLFNERESLNLEQNFSSFSNSLTPLESTQQKSLPSVSVKLDQSFEKTMTQTLNLYGQEHHQQLTLENQKILVPELER